MPIFTPRFRLVTQRLLSLFVLSCLMAPLLASLPVRAAPSVRIVYVKADAPFVNSGASWEEARSLQGALQNFIPGDEIWVAAGIYIPNTIDSSFPLYRGLALYGGFAGNETSREQRDFTTHLSVLSGDMDNDDNKGLTGVISNTNDIVGSNAYHIVMGEATTVSDLDSSSVLDGFTITGGDAFDAGDSLCPACGGGLVMINGSATLANLVFSGNRAGDGGGGMYLDDSSPTLTNVTFTGNLSKFDGGGMYDTVGSAPSLTNVSFSGNQADHNGGGMYNTDSSSPNLTHVTFGGNSAVSGGGIYNNDKSNPIVELVTFDDNQVPNSGGGMYNYSSSPTLSNVIFSHNSASYGGGLYGYNSGSVLTNVSFIGNRVGDGTNGDVASRLASRIVNDLANPVVSNVTPAANIPFNGGGIYITSSYLTLTNVTFSGNRATDVGGGIYNFGGTFTMKNGLFSGNVALNGRGGGMYNENVFSYPVVTNVTLSGNFAGDDGGGIYNYESYVELRNTILWDNEPDSFVETNAITNVYYSLVEGLIALGPGDINGEDSANAPLFLRRVDCGIDECTDDPVTAGVDESANDDYGDLRLQSTSPGVDGGDNSVIAGITSDLAGQPRIVAVKTLPAKVDMGAYEAAPAPHAGVGGPYSGIEGGSIALDGLASSDAGHITNYAWDCTNDGTVDFNGASATGNACTYADSGSFTLRLTVENAVNATDTATTTVTVANVAPVYTPASNQSTFAASAKLFVLGSFADPGAEGSWPITIDWDDNSTPTEFAVSATGNLPAKSHTYATAGTYNVLLTVGDGEESKEGGFQVTVDSPPLGAPAVTPPADQTATAGTDQSFALGSFTDPDSSDPWQVSVNWGDGSAATQFSAASSGTLAAKPHTYAANGAYDALVTVSDDALSASASFGVVVTSDNNAGGVAGLVFDDANANGIQEQGEQGVAGAEIRLENAAQGGVARVALTRTTTTDAEGRYRIDNVPPGDYTLTVIPPADYATLGTTEGPIAVQTGETTTAPTFTLKLNDGDDGGSNFLPSVQRP